MLAKSKLNSIETLISQALIDMEISHEEFITILKEKDKYEKMKESLRSENEKQEIMALSSIKSKTSVKNSQKLLSILCHQNLFFFVCMYKMVDISAKTWNKAEVSVIKIHKSDNVNKTLLKVLCIYDIAKKWGGKNIYNLIDKKITKGKYMVKNMSDLTKPQIRKYKIGRAKLILKSKYSMYVHEDIAITIIMQSRLSDPKTIKFRADLGFNQINLILKK